MVPLLFFHLLFQFLFSPGFLKAFQRGWRYFPGIILPLLAIKGTEQTRLVAFAPVQGIPVKENACRDR